MNIDESIKDQFKNEFSSGAFKAIDGECCIVGKYGRISRLSDGAYDCWLIGENLEPLSGRKLNAILRKCGEGFTKGAGEAWGQGRGKAWVLEMAGHCGVRRRRRISKTTRSKLGNQLAKARVA